MFEPRPSEHFEPSINTKNRWTYTRKASFNAAGVQLPGLFITSGFDMDSAAIVAVVALEAWGLYSIISLIGLSDVEDGAFNILGLAVIVALFLLDVALAFIRHLPAGPDCRTRNKLVLAVSPHERHELERERGLRRFLTPLCTILILGMAGGKIFFFYKLNYGEINGVTLSVLVSYVFAALLHINNTGFYIAGLHFSWRMRREYSKWARVSDDSHEVTIFAFRPFPIDIPEGETIRIQETSAANHTIVKEAGGQYILKTWGVLTDGQLNALIVQQPGDNAKATVARVGLRAQLYILDAPPLPQPAQARQEDDSRGPGEDYPRDVNAPSAKTQRGGSA